MGIVNFQFVTRILLHLRNKLINDKYIKKLKGLSKEVSYNSAGQAFPNFTDKPLSDWNHPAVGECEYG